jgi:glycosyltransferase involved in cell wall biosynthesis
MEITVIIPTYNRCTRLNILFESLLNQTFPQSKYEVIVIDNGSTDDTKEVCDRFSNQFENFAYIFTKDPGLHVGRHEGLKHANSEILSFIDDDVRLFPSWLQGVSNSFAQDKVVLVGGANIPEFEITPPLWLKNMWEREISPGKKAIGSLSVLDFGDQICEISPYYVWGCNFSIRKRILLEANGFHPDSFPSNLIFLRGDGETAVSSYIKQSGLITLYNPQASLYHFVPASRMTVNYFLQRSFNQGISNSYSRLRNLSINTTAGTPRFFDYSKIWINIAKRWFKILLMPKGQKKEIAIIEAKMYIHQQKGSRYHHREYRNNKRIQEWVKRESYIKDYTY